MSYKVESVIDGFRVELIHPLRREDLTRDYDIVDFLGGEEKGLLGMAQFRVYPPLTGVDDLGGFCLSPLPGNCGVVVSHYAYIANRHRGVGNGAKLTGVREKLAKMLGYSTIMATVECTNIRQVAIMLNRKWNVDKTFHNKRSGHDCFIWTKLL